MRGLKVVREREKERDTAIERLKHRKRKWQEQPEIECERER